MKKQSNKKNVVPRSPTPPMERMSAEEYCESQWRARGFASAKDMDNWLWAGQPDRVNYCPARPGPGASKEEYDNWLYSGGGH